MPTAGSLACHSARKSLGPSVGRPQRPPFIGNMMLCCVASSGVKHYYSHQVAGEVRQLGWCDGVTRKLGVSVA